MLELLAVVVLVVVLVVSVEDDVVLLVVSVDGVLVVSAVVSEDGVVLELAVTLAVVSSLVVVFVWPSLPLELSLVDVVTVASAGEPYDRKKVTAVSKAAIFLNFILAFIKKPLIFFSCPSLVEFIRDYKEYPGKFFIIRKLFFVVRKHALFLLLLSDFFGDELKGDPLTIWNGKMDHARFYKAGF